MQRVSFPETCEASHRHAQSMNARGTSWSNMNHQQIAVPVTDSSEN
jgi:hypothetical protein